MPTTQIPSHDPLSREAVTFLELPPDAKKLTRRPDAKVISDKGRIANSKAPQINREDLKKLLESRRPGRPGANVQQPPAEGQAAQNQPAPAPPPDSQKFAQPPPSDQTARWQAPPQPKLKPNFNPWMPAGSAFLEAEQQ